MNVINSEFYAEQTKETVHEYARELCGMYIVCIYLHYYAHSLRRIQKTKKIHISPHKFVMVPQPLDIIFKGI